jgi:hypothetical protein
MSEIIVQETLYTQIHLKVRIKSTFSFTPRLLTVHCFNYLKLPKELSQEDINSDCGQYVYHVYCIYIPFLFFVTERQTTESAGSVSIKKISKKFVNECIIMASSKVTGIEGLIGIISNRHLIKFRLQRDGVVPLYKFD